MFDRFKDRKIYLNDSNNYKKLFEERNVKFINQYGTSKFVYPTPEDMYKFTILKHTWSVGDRFYKLAHKYYGDSRNWWVIAQFNNTPTESHVVVGQVLNIPTPLSKVLNYLNG